VLLRGIGRGIDRGIGARDIVTGTGTAPTFQDFFASGDLSHSENNWGWLDNSGLNASVTVVADNPVPGLGSSYSCRFTYVGVANCTDNRPELRLTYNGNSESWGGNGPAEAFFEFYHYYPDGTESWGGAQYSHRTQVGCADATNNNKWIIMGGNQSSGPIKWIESEAASGGESFLTMKNRHLSGGDAQSNPNSEDGSKGIHSGMYGQWTRWNWQVRVPSGSGNTDGLQRLWRDGVLWKDGNGTASEEQGSGFGELTAHGYFFGASNSGFSSTTYIFLGGVRIWFNSSLGQSAPTGWPNPL